MHLNFYAAVKNNPKNYVFCAVKTFRDRNVADSVVKQIIKLLEVTKHI